MGWWSTDIMGGDTPLDYKDEIFDICGVNEYAGIGSLIPLTKEDITKNLDAILEMCENANDPIAYQVLGVKIMECGAEMSDELKSIIIENAQADEWAEEDEQRANVIADFIEKLESYNGTPIQDTTGN